MTTARSRLVDEYYPAFLEQLALDRRSVPGYVRREFEAYLQCGRLLFLDPR